MNISCIIVDDEPYARELLTDYIEKVPYLQLEGSFSNGLEAMTSLKRTSVDVIFLDIQMPDITGVDLLKVLTHQPHVIMTTAYAEYAVEGFELNVTDYLLKPFDFPRFLKAVDKVYSLQTPNATATSSADAENLFVKDGNAWVRVPISSILYVKGMKDYVKIITEEKSVMSLQTLKGLAKQLPAHQFARVHNSYIVTLDRIDRIVKNKVTIGEHIVPISEKYKLTFMKMIGSRL